MVDQSQHISFMEGLVAADLVIAFKTAGLKDGEKLDKRQIAALLSGDDHILDRESVENALQIHWESQRGKVTISTLSTFML